MNGGNSIIVTQSPKLNDNPPRGGITAKVHFSAILISLGGGVPKRKFVKVSRQF